MKKFICMLAAFVCAFAAFSFTGCVRGEAIVEYTLSDDGTYYILSGVSGDKYGLTTYEIPETYAEQEGGEKLPVKEIGKGAFIHCGALTQITIPDTVEVIGDGAFGACESLKEIIVPESVVNLEQRAFIYCSGLEKAFVKAKIEDLKYRTFYNSVADYSGSVYTNTALKEVYLPSSLKKIDRYALYGNMITDIYFAGNEEEWKNVYFYEIVKEDNGQEKEKIYTKDERNQLLGNVTVHISYQF